MRSAAWLVIVLVVVGTATSLGFQLERAGTIGFWLLVAGPTVMLAGALAFARRKSDGAAMREWMRPSWGDFTAGFMVTLVLFVACYGATKLLAPPDSDRSSWLARLYLQLGNPMVLRANALFVAGALLVAATAEEILWRGFVTSLLAEKVGDRTAWIYSAVAYALAHLPTLWALRDPVAGLNPVLPALALVAGLVWGALARREGRLVPGILSHALFDWAVVMMFRLWGPSV